MMTRLGWTILMLLAVFNSAVITGYGQNVTAQKDKEYKKLVGEYRDLTKQLDELWNKAIADDPALERAKYWLENERLEINTPFAQEERKFFSTLTDDEKKLYRDWLSGTAAKIHLKVFENEWKKYPHSHRALLFWAAVTIKMLERQTPNSDNKPVAETGKPEDLQWADALIQRYSPEHQESNSADNPVSEVKGSEDSQWASFLVYAKQHNAALMERASGLAERLHIEKTMIC
ncbi:MAG: hypothetical protein LBT46_00890 [Planctomycetaceae bacterium]|nr:hypothetical protein [Planctomycetaceae bacterium]